MLIFLHLPTIDFAYFEYYKKKNITIIHTALHCPSGRYEISFSNVSRTILSFSYGEYQNFSCKKLFFV